MIYFIIISEFISTLFCFTMDKFKYKNESNLRLVKYWKSFHLRVRCIQIHIKFHLDFFLNLRVTAIYMDAQVCIALSFPRVLSYYCMFVYVQ